MKTFITKTFLLSFFISAFSTFANGQTGGVPLGGSILVHPDGTGGPNCLAADLTMNVYLTNLDIHAPTGDLRIEYLPDGYPPLFLKFSIDGGPFQYKELTEFIYHDQINGHSVYVASVERVNNSYCEQCMTSDDPVYINYTMELLTTILIDDGQTQDELYIPYPACSYTGPNDIFSCEVFESAGACGTDDCSSIELTTYEGSHLVCNGEEEDPIVDSRESNRANISSTSVNLLAFPNPFTSSLEVNWSENLEVKNITLIDITGKLINQWNPSQISSSTTLNIDSKNLPKGIYFVKLNSTTSTELIKVIKQ